jgi:subfamily B ATP-binding cassette protein MsbA
MTLRNKRAPQTLPLLGIDARYLGYLKAFWPLLLLSVVLIFAVAGLDILAPWPLKFIVDNVLGGQPFTTPFGVWLTDTFGTDQRVLTAVLGLMMLGITLAMGATAFAFEYVSGQIQVRSTFALRSDVFHHVQRLPLQFFDQSRVGDVLKRVTDDAARIMDALVSSVGELVVDSVKFVGFAAVMLFVNWRFSVIVLAYVPLMLFLYVTFRQKIREAAKVARDQEGEMTNLTLETLGAIREVKAFGREPLQQAEFEARGRDRIESALQSIRWEASFSPTVDFVQAASTAAVVWYGVSQVLVGQFTIGELLIFMAYLRDIYRPLRHFSKITANLQKAAASGERLATVLDADIGIEDAPDAAPLVRAQGEIAFQGVSFAYPGAPDKTILRNVSFAARRGQVIALVGATGAGKSTIASLLMRFYDITGGRILLDGVDVRRIRIEDLRRQFAIVPQESVLFARSVRDNIAYGRPEASDEEIVAAAVTANAHEFILRLPKGYATVVGERGGTLSGGQRQRIAIARALLRNAPILVLDEPTAALDAESEDLVMSALDRLMAGRTTVIIAHRLSTIRNADQIIVLDQGGVVEQGRHDELVRGDGVYARLVRLQSGDGEPLDREAAASRVASSWMEALA